MTNKYKDYGWAIRPNQSLATKVIGVLINGFLLAFPLLNVLVAYKLCNAYFLKLWKGNQDYIGELEDDDLKSIQLWTSFSFVSGVVFTCIVYLIDTPDASLVVGTFLMWAIGGLISYVRSNNIRKRLDLNGDSFTYESTEVTSYQTTPYDASRFEGTGLNFVAFDFETANYDRDSACQLGIVVVENGVIIDQKSWLIKPQPNKFLVRFTDIHGIDKYDVEDAPRFKDLWEEVEPYISGKLLVAHNVEFDESVLNACLYKYKLPKPKYETMDTLALSRICFNTHNHKLPTLCKKLGIDLDHHDALSDSRAAALLFMCCCEKLGAYDTESLEAAIYSNSQVYSVDSIVHISFGKKKAISFDEVVQIMEKQDDYALTKGVHSASFHLFNDGFRLKKLLSKTSSWKKEIVLEGINLKHSELTKLIRMSQIPSHKREDYYFDGESDTFMDLLSVIDNKRKAL